MGKGGMMARQRAVAPTMEQTQAWLEQLQEDQQEQAKAQP
jgi:hypothetical protein